MILKTGSIYSILYSRWKTNQKVYAFIFYAGASSQYVHAINIGAKQLNYIQQVKILRTIQKLMKVPNASKYNGRMLYRIFKTYLPKEIGRCYRTYKANFIVQAVMINPCLNDPSSITELEKRFYNKDLYKRAKQDYVVKTMDLFFGRGDLMKTFEQGVAKPKIVPNTPSQNKPNDAQKIVIDVDEKDISQQQKQTINEEDIY